MSTWRLATACGFAASLWLASASDPTEAATRSEVKRIVVEESLRAGFPPSLAMAVAKAESDFQDRAQGPEGRRGVMQVLPKTAEDIYGVDPERLWDPRLNVQLGIDRLQSLIRRYDGRWETALARYGEDPVSEDRAEPRADTTTSAFVNKVMRLQRQYRKEARSWAKELRSGSGPIAAIRAPYARENRDLKIPSRLRPLSEAPRRPDDFEKAIEVRRRAARRHLDDFAPLVRRNDS